MISVEKLVKDYGAFRALHNVSFEVQEGEIFGLLGPNGAGKTTTVEILEGIRDRTSGQVPSRSSTRYAPGGHSECRIRTPLPPNIHVFQGALPFKPER